MEVPDGRSPRTGVSPRFAFCRVLLVLLMAVSVSGCDEKLIPPDLAQGWTKTDAPQTPAEPSTSDEGLFPGISISDLKVYKDWRWGHDPTKPCPDEMVLVQGQFCIDKWEGTLVEVTAMGPRPFPPTHEVGMRPVRAVSEPGVFPQAYISGAQAQRACAMVGKRLCTDKEWWRACAGSKHTIYPYGTVHHDRACNEERPKHPMLQLYGDDAGPEIWYVKPMNNPAINEQAVTLSLTGARSRCVSEAGIYDMVGNVHEWVADPAGTFRGGAYSGKIRLGCQYVTTAHGFSYHDYSTGFRCCTDPFGKP